MKKIVPFLIAAATTVCFNANAQYGIITTIAGNGIAGQSGDGGPATVAEMSWPASCVVDNSGNVYIVANNNYCVRKVSPSGIITNIAGTGYAGFGGDGGPASAAQFNYTLGITMDTAGNIYIVDSYNNRIRKINTTGIISTVAGGGTTIGDGGPATAAFLNWPTGVVTDNSGNLYIADYNNSRVRKVNTSGIITTIAGNGTPGFSGDGGPATAAELNTPENIALDNLGNLYITDFGNNRIRMVNPSGIMTTIAGTGTMGHGGDGGPATAAQISNISGTRPWGGVCPDNHGNIYIADYANNNIRKIDNSGIITTVAGVDTAAGYSGDSDPAIYAKFYGPVFITKDNSGSLYVCDQMNEAVRKIQNALTSPLGSFCVITDNNCPGLNFQIITNHYSASQHITTYFGNGSYFDTVTTLYSTYGTINLSEPYASSGTYTIKHVLYNGTTALDSVAYSHSVLFCRDLPLVFYYDAMGNCIYTDSADFLNVFPVLVEVDSNSTAIDTISVSSGLYYTAYGNPGDIYTFRVISTDTGVAITCPSTGIILDTLTTGVIATKFFGFRCTGSTNFDLGIYGNSHSGHHYEGLNVYLYNTYCTPEPAVFTLNFDTKYSFYGAIPIPSSVIGNSLTWNLGPLSFLNSPTHIYVDLDGGHNSPGDTVLTTGSITPITGDVDTLNNYMVIIDTVRAGYDPNEMSVTPAYCIPTNSVTQLQYTILFENTGNDTAHNIYIMDTLSDNLDPRSLRIVSASNIMNISKWYDNTAHNIYKFDFPKINLLDSSHHGQCDGVVSFNINTKAGLAAGATVFNHAGIYFDDNPVVMTNKVENKVVCPSGIHTPLPAPTPSLHPNPAANELIIQANKDVYTSFTVTNTIGQFIIAQNITGTLTTVNVQSLPVGVYYITFRGAGGSVVEKFVKE